LEATFATFQRDVDELMCFMLSIALRTQSNKGILRAINDTVWHATIAALSHGRVIVGIDTVLGEAVNTVTVNHLQQ